MGKKQPKQENKVNQKVKKRCIVGYKKAVLKDSGQVFREIFDELVPCCDSFKRWFERTGHRKISSFSQLFNPPHEWKHNGFNLTTKENRFILVNRLELSLHNLVEDEIRFCQSCGTPVEVKWTKTVYLKPRTKEIFDGYDEYDKEIK